MESMPPAPTLPSLPGNTRCSLVETDDLAGGTRHAILGEILALSAAELGSALETVLRSLTITAALSDAVLETRAACTEAPVGTPSDALQALARDLWNAGFGVKFAPSWTPVPDGAVGLGVLGAERELEGFLRTHPSWWPI
jgi:hypothetical protein